MINRGVFKGINADGTVCGQLPTKELALKPEFCYEYVAEQFLQPVDAQAIPELAKLAIINTIHVDEPDDPDTVWGFVTDASFKFNGQPKITD